MTFPAGPRPDARPRRDGGPTARPETDDAGTLAALYDRHAGAMYSLAMRIAGEPGAAEEIVRGVFAAARSEAGRRPGAGGPDAHGLLAATRVRAIEHLRAGGAAGGAASTVPEAESDDVPPDPRPGDTATLRLPDPARGRVADEHGPDDAPLLRSALRELPPLDRLAIELAYFEGLTISRIGMRLEQTPKAVNTRLRAGLRRLAGRGEAPRPAQPRRDPPPTRDLAGLYALGALNPSERAAFDAHLEAHRESVDEVLRLLPVARRLAWTAPPHQPPARLRERVLETVTGAPPRRAEEQEAAGRDRPTENAPVEPTARAASEPAEQETAGSPRPPEDDAPAEPAARAPAEHAEQASAAGPTAKVPAETAEPTPAALPPTRVSSETAEQAPAAEPTAKAPTETAEQETAGSPRPPEDDAPAEPTAKATAETAEQTSADRPPARLPAETAEQASTATPAPAAGAQQRGGRRALVALAAASLVAVAGLGLLVGRQSRLATALQENLDAANAQARIAELETEAAQRIANALRGGAGVLAADDVRILDLAGQPAAPRARGRLFRQPGGGAFFAAVGLPPLPPGRVYQLWLIPDATPVSAALLRVDADGRALAAVTPPAGVIESVPAALTQESAGGVASPSGNVYLLGRP